MDNQAMLSLIIAEEGEDLTYLRDAFAADCLRKAFDNECAMQIAHRPQIAETLAKVCYLMADEMLKARYVEPVKVTTPPPAPAPGIH